MKISSGILFVHKNKALLAHSTNSSWWGTWMPPKGGQSIGESIEETAIREVEEEIGIRVSKDLLNKFFVVDYTDKKGKIYKKVTIFVIRLNNIKFEDNQGVFLTGSGLQTSEVDRIEWMDSREINLRGSRLYVKQILNEIEK